MSKLLKELRANVKKYQEREEQEKQKAREILEKRINDLFESLKQYMLILSHEGKFFIDTAGYCRLEDMTMASALKEKFESNELSVEIHNDPLRLIISWKEITEHTT